MNTLRSLACALLLAITGSASADMITLVWRHDILPLSHAIMINYDFDGETYMVRFEELNANDPSDLFELMPFMDAQLSNSGTALFNIEPLQAGITYHIKYRVVDPGTLQTLETGYLYGVTPLPIPTFTPVQPYMFGGTTFFEIFTTEYGNPDWFDPLLMGSSDYETVLTIYLEHESGQTYSESRVLDGAGNLSQEIFQFDLLLTGEYEYCFEMTYAEIAGNGDFGPVPVMTTCLDPDSYYFGGGSLDVSGGLGSTSSILFANGLITVTNDDGSVGTYQIVETSGRLVCAGPTSKPFDVSGLSSGVYAVTAFDSTGRVKAHQTYSIVR